MDKRKIVPVDRFDYLMSARSHLQTAKLWFRWIFLAAAFPLLVFPMQLFGAVHDFTPKPRQNDRELIVKFRQGANSSDRTRALKNAASVKPLHMGRGRKDVRAAATQPVLNRLEIPENVEVEAELARLQRNPAVEYVEPNHSLRLFANQLSEVFPNDFEFLKMYSLHNLGGDNARTNADIGAPEAWALGTGSKSVVVAVIDTGLDYLHADLKDNLWINAQEVPFNGMDDDRNGLVDDVNGYDFVSNDSDPFDDNQHGTHVAGTIGAKGNNGIGTVGVCWEVSLMALKAFDENGNGTVADAIAAMSYAVENGARIINASWGLDERSRALEEAAQSAADAGVLMIAAAGNNRSEAPSYPASFETVLSVGATDARDARADFSNFGAYVDVAAPGANIISTFPENSYGYLSGTSMAAPHVSGVAALVLARFPFFTRDELFDILVNSVDVVAFDQPIGNGRINAARAVQTEQPLPTARVSVAPTVSGIVDVTGRASGTFFSGYSVNVGAGRTPRSWTQIASSAAPVTNDVLARLDSALLPDGPAVVQLVVTNRNGATAISTAPVRVFNGLISYPLSGDVLEPARYVVRGTVYGPGKTFELSYGSGFNPTNWTVIASGGTGYLDSRLGDWDASDLPTGHYGLRLVISNGTNRTEFSAPMIYIDRNLKPGWPLYVSTDSDFPATEWRNVRPADLDGDGKSELVLVDAGTRNRKQQLRVYGVDGTIVWNRELGFDIPPDLPAIGDVDGDGKKEIFVDGTNGIVAFRHDGSVLDGWPVQTATRNHAKVLADVDGDGRLELIAYSQEYAAIQVAEQRELSVYNLEGERIRNWMLPWCGFTNDVQKIFPAVANLDSDTGAEIVVPSGCSELLAFDVENPDPKWRASISGKMLSSPVIGDVDGNFFVDVVVAVASANPGDSAGIYVFDRFGQRWRGWPVLEEYSFITTPALGDLDRDGRLEIVVIDHAIGAQLHVVQWDGLEADGWPRKLFSNTSSRVGVSIADVNNDRFPEILLSIPGYPGLAMGQQDPDFLGGIIARDFAGRVVPLNGTNLVASVPFESAGQARYHKSPPVVMGDIDSNGKLDFVLSSVQDRTFGSLTKFKDRSSLYAWEVNTPTPEMEWPMFGHDIANTGTYALPLSPGPIPTNVTRAIRDRLIGSEDRELRIEPTTNDWNATEAPLEIVSISAPQHGAVTRDGSTLAYMPVTNFSGMDRFTYEIRDVEGRFSTAEVILRVKPLNDPPKAESFDFTIRKNSSVDINYKAFDVESAKLSFRIVDPPQHGELWNYPTFGTYYPAKGYFGSDSFAYVANDGRLDSAPASITITILNSNNPPEAVAQTLLTKTNRAVFITPNGSDPDGDPVTFELVTEPRVGTATPEGNGFRFTPPQDYVGEDSFLIRAYDGTAFSENALVTIGIIATNAAPRASDGTAVVQPNAESTLRLSGSDPDGDNVNFVVVTEPLHGRLSGMPPQVVYLPDTNYLGPDRFEFKVTDGLAESATATFTIQVSRQNRPPESEDQSVFVENNLPRNFTLDAFDPDDDPVRTVILKGPLNGIVYGAGTNVTFVPKSGVIGTDSFTYKLWDGQRFGNVARVLVTISFPGENPLPEFANIRHDNGVAEITLNLQSSKTFSIEASTNLVDWSIILPSTSSQGSPFLFRDTNAPARMRYYRAIRE